MKKPSLIICLLSDIDLTTPFAQLLRKTEPSTKECVGGVLLAKNVVLLDLASHHDTYVKLCSAFVSAQAPYIVVAMNPEEAIAVLTPGVSIFQALESLNVSCIPLPKD
ncbi:MAG: hypothetical protein Q8O79_00355 [Pseudomonadota bacterium]|nr:hypothetical protein [Pseudomonadota bacterium]